MASSSSSARQPRTRGTPSRVTSFKKRRGGRTTSTTAKSCPDTWAIHHHRTISLGNDDEEEGDDDEEEEEEDKEGRWSALSWSSLYDRASESSLSWTDDNLEKEASEKVTACFDRIDQLLYEGLADPRLPTEVSQDCELWRSTFPHLRILGHAIRPPTPTESRSPTTVISSSMAAISLDEEEEVILEDTRPPTPPPLDRHPAAADQGLLASPKEPDWSLSEKFLSNPKSYLVEKLTKAVFKHVWSQVSGEAQLLVDAWIQHRQEDLHVDLQPPLPHRTRPPGRPSYLKMNSQFDSIDEHRALTKPLQIESIIKPDSGIRCLPDVKPVPLMVRNKGIHNPDRVRKKLPRSATISSRLTNSKPPEFTEFFSISQLKQSSPGRHRSQSGSPTTDDRKTKKTVSTKGSQALPLTLPPVITNPSPSSCSGHSSRLGSSSSLSSISSRLRRPPWGPMGSEARLMTAWAADSRGNSARPVSITTSDNKMALSGTRLSSNGSLDRQPSRLNAAHWDALTMLTTSSGGSSGITSTTTPTTRVKPKFTI